MIQIILLALAGTWADIFLSLTTGVIFGPVIVWTGILYFLQKQKTFERILWITSFAAWNCFLGQYTEVILLTVIFLAISETMNFIFGRFVPEESHQLRFLISTTAAVVATTLYILVTLKYFGVQVIIPILLMTIISLLCVLYVQKKEK